MNLVGIQGDNPTVSVEPDNEMLTSGCFTGVPGSRRVCTDAGDLLLLVRMESFQQWFNPGVTEGGGEWVQ